MAKKGKRGSKSAKGGGGRGMEFDAGAVQALRRGGAGPEFVHHQHVLYSCDLVDTQQKMACPATIAKIYQRDGAWEYDISFTDPSNVL